MAYPSIRNSHLYRTAILLAVNSLVASGACCFAASGGETFASPEEAARALLSAAETGGTNGILKVLGPGASDLVTTSDPVADRRVRETFVNKARRKMVVTADPQAPGQKILKIGDDGWPFPIPVVQAAGRWQFDVARGRRTIRLRRIGDDELTALDVCRGYVEAQTEYFDRDPSGSGTRQYAQKFISTEGQRDGLYWPSKGPDDESPAGELVARALAEGYTDKSQPYHGYYFRVLKGQGANASGGAMDYMDGSSMTRGFALIAWPADYRKSGVTTFLVDRSGIVYQKDLGQKTSETASATTLYDPDQTWTPVAGAGVTKTARAVPRKPAAHR
jgi:hypothetical protein